MDEAVLVLRLHHVVPLRAHQRHVAVDVHGALVSNALQHGVDDDETAGATDTGAERETNNLDVREDFIFDISFQVSLCRNWHFL